MPNRDDIFLDAREMSDSAKRFAYLSKACGDDIGLRSEVEAMLREAERADSFFGPDDERQLQTDFRRETTGTVIGRYKLLEKIGEGGMGVVYMAEQREPVLRKVAIKIIKAEMSTRPVIARFEAERQALALMDHPNITKVLDGGETETGRPYFVMDLVQGLPITQFCAEAKLPTRGLLALFLEVCSAMQHAHQKGIIHRDIKPSNILVTLHDGVAVPKIIDFGIAKATQQLLTDKTLFTQFQHFIGTPAYMSPEQASLSGLDIDTRSDIYGLGVLLYELLTGTPPFDGQELLKLGLDEMRRTICDKKPLRPSTRVINLFSDNVGIKAKLRNFEAQKLIAVLRGDLDWIVMKCLEKDRDRRYETANGVAMDLRRFLSGEPVVARPPSHWYEFRKAVLRHKVGFAATAAVILALAAGVEPTDAALACRSIESTAALGAALLRIQQGEGEMLLARALESAEDLLKRDPSNVGFAQVRIRVLTHMASGGAGWAGDNDTPLAERQRRLGVAKAHFDHASALLGILKPKVAANLLRADLAHAEAELAANTLRLDTQAGR